MSLLAGQVHSLSATTPLKLKTGKPPWCCPRQTEFWRLCCTSWCAAYWKSKCTEATKDVHLEKLVRLPGVAPGHSPWRGDILLLNHSRKESKRAGSVFAPGPRHFNKEQTPLGDLLRSQPAVSRRLFRCLGAHLLRSPLIVKSSADTLACFLAPAGQNPSVESLGSPTP